MQRSEGNFFWFRLFMMISVCFTFVWQWGWKGVVPGMFVAVAFAIFGDVLRGFYCSIAVHPNGWHGYKASKEYLSKYMLGGPAQHKVSRNFFIYKWIYFLYSGDSDRWSWRPYALLLTLAIICYLSPLFFGAIVTVILSISVSTWKKGASVPTSLYLGSSSQKSHRLLANIGSISSIKWASLLRDETQLSENSSKLDMQVFMMGQALSRNVWSLRTDNDKWMEVVSDFINASAIIVLWPDINDAVQEEIDYLSQLDLLDRVIVINTGPLSVEKLPHSLYKCLMTEKAAMKLISLTASNPRLFKQQLSERMDE